MEVTRTATDGSRNACSMLYGAAWRAAEALGYVRAVPTPRTACTGRRSAPLAGRPWRIARPGPAAPLTGGDPSSVPWPVRGRPGRDRPPQRSAREFRAALGRPRRASRCGAGCGRERAGRPGGR
ncbi:hypothetical protein [Sphaerisporangium sp. NPDC051011]|uniref:hypothetical protein n=1 Tax=Sphaerisporangium sp. NPDC051011 TaxID=3155792 RepID=UPI0033EEBC1F